MTAPDDSLVSVRASASTSKRIRKASLMVIVACCVGIASGASFIASNDLVGTPAPSTLLACGFEKGPYWDLIGSGVPSGTPYIATSTLNAYQTTVVSTASITAYAYGGGTGTEEYLVGEIAFMCTSLPTPTTVVALTISDTTPLGASATYAVVFAQTSASASTNPTTTTACAGTSPNLLYEPQGGGTVWAWDAVSGGLISGGTCSLGSGSVSTSVTTASSTVPVFTLSFGFVGMSASTCSSSCPTYTTYTISFTAHNP